MFIHVYFVLKLVVVKSGRDDRLFQNSGHITLKHAKTVISCLNLVINGQNLKDETFLISKERHDERPVTNNM